MTVLVPHISGVGSHHSTNSATTAAFKIVHFIVQIKHFGTKSLFVRKFWVLL